MEELKEISGSALPGSELVKKQFNFKLWGASALAAIILATGGYFAYTKYGEKLGIKEESIKTIFREEEKAVNETTTEESKNADETANWKIYANDTIGANFKYPSTWKTIALEKITPNQEFAAGHYYHNGSGFFDPESIYSFYFQSSDYSTYLDILLNQKKINLNWTKEEFVANMKTNEKVLGYKKIGQNSALMTMYFCYEGVCDFFVKVISPNNDSYPNFIIKIAMPEISGAAAVENEQRAAGNEPEQALTQFYQGVSDKIFAGTYSEEVASRIKTAQLIADTLGSLETKASWKTYKNNDQKYSIKHPSYFVSEPIEDSIAFYNPAEPATRMFIQKKPTKDFVSGNAKTVERYIKDDSYNQNIRDVLLGSKKAYRYDSPGMGGLYTNIVAEVNDQVYWLHFQEGDLTSTQEEMISTFQFDS